VLGDGLDDQRVHVEAEPGREHRGAHHPDGILDETNPGIADRTDRSPLEIAQSAEFFSFGTNDLTQTGLGMSRDDSGSFLPQYQELEIVTKNPFATIDSSGVGQLVAIAVEKGRASRPNIKLGICGEHGGDPASIRFFEKVGLDYVSCSPYRVPVARLAAAQAALQVKGED